MTELRPELPDLPRYIQRLPVDKRGYPVPWFVAWIDGEPDFRIMREEAIGDAWKNDKCWVCGQRMGRFRAFAIGPMCVVNRVSAEPPSHLDCATFSIQACPFLTRPHMRRRTAGRPEEAKKPAGHMIERNPGAMALWVTTKPRIKIEEGLFRFDPAFEDLTWWARGREASRDEVMESITSGLPLLREAAEGGRPGDVRKLERELERAMTLVPA